MKKVFLVLTVAVTLTTTAWAQPEFSFGGGLLAGGDLGGGVKGVINSYTVTTSTPHFGGGVYAFFDAKYAEVSLEYCIARETGRVSTNSPGIPDSVVYGIMNIFTVELLGKYPVHINPRMRLFPLLGINYQMILSVGPDSLDTLWFQFGGGIDHDITQKIYFRGEILYGFRLANEFEKHLVDETYENVSPGSTVESNPRLGHGPTIKLAVGYKL